MKRLYRRLAFPIILVGGIVWLFVVAYSDGDKKLSALVDKGIVAEVTIVKEERKVTAFDKDLEYHELSIAYQDDATGKKLVRLIRNCEGSSWDNKISINCYQRDAMKFDSDGNNGEFKYKVGTKMPMIFTPNADETLLSNDSEILFSFQVEAILKLRAQ